MERLHGRERAVARCVHVREVDHRAHPAEPGQIARMSSRLPKSLTRPMISTPNGTPRSLASMRLRKSASCERTERPSACAFGPGETPGGKRPARPGDLRDPGRVVEHPGRHPVLAVALDVAHEPGDRRVHRERDPPLARELPELLGPRVVHPEAGLEVDLAGRVPALDGGVRRPALGAFPRRHPRRAKSELSHAKTLLSRLSNRLREWSSRSGPHAREVEWRFARDRTIRAFAYNGEVPGPPDRGHVGDALEVRHESLPEATAIHWHGLRIPAAMDGTEIVQRPVEPGETLPTASACRTPAPSGTTRTSTRPCSSSAGSTAR